MGPLPHQSENMRSKISEAWWEPTTADRTRWLWRCLLGMIVKMVVMMVEMAVEMISEMIADVNWRWLWRCLVKTHRTGTASL